MGWPEAFVVAFNVVQVVALAYLAARQAQVKRDLNGSADEIQMQLIHLHDLMADRSKSSGPRAYGALPAGPVGEVRQPLTD